MTSRSRAPLVRLSTKPPVVPPGAVTAPEWSAAEASIDRHEAATLGFPTIATTNYTRHLSRYASLAAAIADLPDAGAGGGDIHVDGVIGPEVGGTVPAGVTVIGRGSGVSAVEVPAGYVGTAFTIDSAHTAGVVGLSGIVSGGGVTGTGGYLVRVLGACDRPHLEDIHGDGYHGAIIVNGSLGATPGDVTNLHMQRVRGDRSPLSFGIDLYQVDGAHLIDCGGEGNRLDGLKLRAKARNVRVIGGRYNGNGVGDSAGDGIDAYAGGDTFVLIGVETSGNNGHGVTIKQGPGTPYATFGYVKNAQISNHIARGNTGNGIYAPGATDPSIVLPNTLQILGGIFTENGDQGVYIGFRNTIVTGAVAKRNGQNGFFMEVTALRAVFGDCIASGNSQDAAGSFYGFNLAGNSGSLSNCFAVGYADSDDITNVTDEQAGTKYHRLGIAFSPQATGRWTVDASCRSVGHTSPSVSNGIGMASTAATTATVLIDQQGNGSPMATGVHGSPGSRYLDLDTGIWWHRTSGAPGAALSGWQQVTLA